MLLELTQATSEIVKIFAIFEHFLTFSKKLPALQLNFIIVNERPFISRIKQEVKRDDSLSKSQNGLINLTKR